MSGLKLEHMLERRIAPVCGGFFSCNFVNKCVIWSAI